MDSQARVASLDRFQDFRAAYAKFGDAAQQILLGVEIEIRRMMDWLEKDQVAYWKGEIRRREDKVNEARGALHRKRITASFGNVAADTDELVALRRAQARLAEAEAKLREVKRWYLIVEQEISEYRGPAQQLSNILDADVPRALASLDRMMEVIESYLSLRVPVAEGLSGVSVGSAATESVKMTTEGAGATLPPPKTDTEGTPQTNNNLQEKANETEGAS